jgi:hypothetical protein
MLALVWSADPKDFEKGRRYQLSSTGLKIAVVLWLSKNSRLLEQLQD